MILCGKDKICMSNVNNEKNICVECGKEISLNLKNCNYCGYPIKKGNTKKKVLVVMISMLIITIVAAGIWGYNKIKIKKQVESSNKKVAIVNEMINKELKEQIPTQDKYEEIVKRYSELLDNEKNKIEEAELIEKFADLDLDKLREISGKIELINEETDFLDIVELNDEIVNLSSKEKELLNMTPIEEIMQLTGEEKAALAAARNVKSVMKSTSSFEVNSISVKNDVERSNFYWVLINYSGQNGWGAIIDKTSCFGIDDEFKDTFFELNLVLGDIGEYLDSSTSYLEYIKCNKKEEEINVKKIRYYIDKE